ncbi:MAG: OmpA family protein [Elusimicrobiota bacterium]
MLPRREVKEHVGKAAAPWFVNYADLMTQLVCFFVMLFSLSSLKKEQQLQEVKKQVEEVVAEQKLEKAVKAEIKPEGLVISLQEKILFESGKAELSPKAKQVISTLYKVFISLPNQVVVEGHTDNVPIRTSQFPSNWELSTTRATNVVRTLIEDNRFPSNRICASGYAEYKPVTGTVSQQTSEQRASNRRVDFIVQRMPGLGVKQQKSMSGVPRHRNI